LFGSPVEDGFRIAAASDFGSAGGENTSDDSARLGPSQLPA